MNIVGMKWRLQQLDGFGPVLQVKRKSLLVFDRRRA